MHVLEEGEKAENQHSTYPPQEWKETVNSFQRKEKKMRAEILKKEKKSITEKTYKNQSWFFENINKIGYTSRKIG